MKINDELMKINAQMLISTVFFILKKTRCRGFGPAGHPSFIYNVQIQHIRDSYEHYITSIFHGRHACTRVLRFSDES